MNAGRGMRLRERENAREKDFNRRDGKRLSELPLDFCIAGGVSGQNLLRIVLAKMENSG